MLQQESEDAVVRLRYAEWPGEPSFGQVLPVV